VAARADLTEMFRGAEYFSFGGGDFLATSGDDEHRLKPTETDRQQIF